MLSLNLAGRAYPAQGDPNAPIQLIQPMDAEELAHLPEEVAQIEALCGGAPFLLVGLPVDDWNGDLSPWPAPPAFGRQPFGGGADATLRHIHEALLPALSAELPVENPARLIGGYSLAGLFALYAAYQSDGFLGVAAVSPSLWYPDWDAFADAHALRAGYAYLSLGDREERAKNPVMARVGDGVRGEHRRLTATLGDRCALEWNPGNHFAEPDLRTAKGFAWLINRLNSEKT